MEDLKSLVKQIAKLERELDKDCIVLLKDIALENKIETKHHLSATECQAAANIASSIWDQRIEQHKKIEVLEALEARVDKLKSSG